MENTRNMEIGSVVNTNITNVRSHKGYGGTTYIVTANITTSLAGIISGGMVIKFCNDLETEKHNAERLHLLMLDRQKEWDAIGPEKLPDTIKTFPNYIYAPAVLETVQIPETNINCLMLEFVENGIPLIDIKEPGGLSQKLRLLGYSLARLHGTKSFKTKIELYEPLFNAMKGAASEESLRSWYEILKESTGSVEMIHGDSHLQNILKSNNDLAWIDAMLIERSDRMDDLGYSISYIAQKEIRKAQKEGQDPKLIVQNLINNAATSWAPEVIKGYQGTIDTSPLYHYLPLDFFLGSHLIIRSGLWQDEWMKWMLNESGRYFIENSPILRFSNQQK